MSTPSDEETEEEEVSAEGPEEQEEIKPISIFINHLDKYQGQAIAKILPLANEAKTNPAYTIVGTISENDLPEHETAQGNNNPEILNPKHSCFVDWVIANDFIIYDIGSDSSQIEEAHKVLDGLEKYYNKIKGVESMRDVVKYFVLISTPLTWAKTEPIDENTNVLTEEHYRKRRNHHCFAKHKCLEREVINLQKRCKPHIRTVVVCPGFTYGEANDIFHFIFKLAFYNKEIVPYFLTEKNYVPLLYINDYARMIRQIIEDFPEPSIRYILAVQQKLLTLKSFMRNIVFAMTGNVTKIKQIAPEKVLQTYEELIPAHVFHAVTMNIKMAPTYFEDFDFSFEDNFEDFGTILVDEFRKARNLLPIKIIIDGPPAVGKTTLAKCLAEYYKLHYIATEDVIKIVIRSLQDDIYETKTFLKMLEEEKNKPGNEDQDQEVEDDLLDMEDRLNELLEEWNDALDELKGVEAEEDKYEFNKKCLIRLITSKACNENQGYVLDGFPFDYEQASEIFPKIYPEGEGEAEEEEGGESSKYKPDYVILLDASDELLCQRAMAITEKDAKATKRTEDEMLARLEEYRERNQEDRSLLSFFYDNDIIPMTFCITETTKCETVFENIKQEIGAPHIYPLSKSERAAIERLENQLRIMKEMEERRIKEEAAAKEREQREANLQKWTKEFERLKCKEQEMLEAKTLPLRQYLAKFVLPTLTEGLLRVAEVKPEDPVDFLAEYLFECNPTGHVLDPSYSQKVKKLLLDEGDEDISKALDMMAENENDFDCEFFTKKREKTLDSSSTSSRSMTAKKTQDVHETNLANILMRELRHSK